MADRRIHSPYSLPRLTHKVFLVYPNSLDSGIQKEVESKLSYLGEAGGYISAIDHTVPPNVPFENSRFSPESVKRFL